MKTILISILGALLVATGAWGQDRAAILQDCATVADCLGIIEQTLPEKDTGRSFGDEENVAAILKARFGRAARDALLQKAVGDHGGWRNYSGGVLEHWHDWSEEDIPLLSRALELQSGGWIARPLGEIGSPQAIKVLLRDLIKIGIGSQTGWALHNIGVKTLDYVLPSLAEPGYEELPPEADYREGWRAVAALIEAFGSRATIVADEWVEVAVSRRASQMRRVAALRGLAAMNGYLDDKAVALHRLLKDRDKKVADQAFLTLVSVHDPAVAVRFAKTCKPTGEPWDEYVFPTFECLRQLSDFGSNARGAGRLVLPFLESANKSEQLDAIETLGLIGYEPAIPRIESFLESKDWRHVYASVRALAQMRSRSSIPKIESAIEGHWLWELQTYAGRAVSLMLRHQPYSEILGDDWADRLSGFGRYSAPYLGRDECEWNVWTYKGSQLTFEKSTTENDIRLPLRDGELVGTDRGEFGGDLRWKPTSGAEFVLVAENTHAIFPVKDGFVSIHGIGHMMISYGFAAFISRSEDGVWRAEEVARFPAAAYQAKQLGPDLFAANAAGRVIIFSRNGILGTADCDYRARPDQ